MSHPKVQIHAGEEMKIEEKKVYEGHVASHNCGCPNIVTNLITGKRVWTRVQFACGVIKKVNCQILKKITESGD